jgi:hypothetical protein
MSPIAAVAALVSIAVLLASFGHPALAAAPGLAAALLGAILVRIVRRRRLRRMRLEDVSKVALVRGADGKAIAMAQAAWMREQGLLAAESVVHAVQLARTDIAHAGAPEARAVLDDLEREARAHPEGIPGHVVAAARMRFDELMRRNLQ